jgi:beta-galactosidase
MQRSLLRQYTGNCPITTNAFMFRWGDNVDWYELFRDLDVAGIDIYSEEPHEIAFYVDFARALGNGACWTLEYGVRSELLHREMDLLAAHGCEWLFFFKMNPFPWGQEQSMCSMLTIAGEPTAAYETARGWRAVPPASEPARVGLIYDFVSSWAQAISQFPRPLAETWTYSRYAIDSVYRCFFEAGVPVRILGVQDAFDSLGVLVLPMLILYDPDLEQRLVEWVQGGGKLIATADLFQKNADNVYLQRVPDIYRALFGWQGHSPVDQDSIGEKAVVLRNCVGQGEAWLLRTDAVQADWAQVLAQALG